MTAPYIQIEIFTTVPFSCGCKDTSVKCQEQTDAMEQEGKNLDLPDLPGLELAGLAGGESSAASRLSSPGPAREQSTFTTLVSPT